MLDAQAPRKYTLRAAQHLNSYVAHGKKTGADKTQDEDTTNATQQPKTQARAQQHGPSAAAWPELREMARAPHGPSAARAVAARARRIAVCNIEAETRASPGHRPRPSANWLKILVRKFEKLSYWNKTENSDV